jgi:uncharacterized protein
MVKRPAAVIFAIVLVLIAALPVAAAADGTRVFDYAGLLSSDEVERLDAYIAELRAKTGCDFVFLTDTVLAYEEDYDRAERAAIAYADDFYDYGGFGDETNDWSGMIFFLDMTNRIPIITTTGKMIDIINDSRLADLFDTVYNHLADEDYFGAAYNMFAQAKTYIDKGVVPGQYQYDAGPNGVDVEDYYDGIIQPAYMRALTVTDILIAGGVGFVITLIFYASVVSRYSLKGSQYRYDLMTNTEVKLTKSADTFLYQTVTRTPRATSSSGGRGGSGSGTHIGSSGRSHGGGGGGRRF